MKNKKNLRKILLQQMKDFASSPEKEVETNILLEKLFQTSAWKNARSIGITISMPFELPTEKIITQAWQEGKIVAIPKTRENGEMDFFVHTSKTTLEKTTFGVLEPVGAEMSKKKEIDLMIVPHLAITKTGVRLGFGGGFYDRYLADFKNDTLALAYSFQVMQELPQEPFDIVIKTILSIDK
ncbi:5-formyltetrahydrofolate cyclo-ligase [Pilibacter termitis]|uniref:5-formyltetrahydrofolate cyclo-ligase n=1 Tax=Pilibacter termitis TaxID=263852 RepID=A0A1T4PTD7_9ENTE|nr:5-formyltetrahydrofolate cyclo-ligase [Pilibacter termitis]SJZ94790.1 5-formyltetrahydrofolate cyclo-ligase [Pilibacter termitis]